MIEHECDTARKTGIPTDAMVSKSRTGMSSRKRMDRRAVHAIVRKARISQVEFDAAAEEAWVNGVDTEELLVCKYGIPKAELGAALSEYYRCPYIPFHQQTAIDPDLFRNLSHDYLKTHGWVPLERNGTVLQVLMSDPDDIDMVLDIRRVFPGCTMRRAVGLRSDIEQFLGAVRQPRRDSSIEKILGELVSEAGAEVHDEQQAGHNVDENDSAIVRLAGQIIAEADRLGASDIHIEPYSERKDIAVRMRVDGTCFCYMRIPSAYRRAVVSRFKIMANLDIAERRRPQDGKIRYRVTRDRMIDLRVATLPTAGGNEDVVMRLLSTKETRSLEEMECAPDVLASIQMLADRPYGMFLCVGPTGSGKTTTLHAVLKRINTDERKIWTAEDPIEITQDGLRQVQVHPKIGFTFATAMRAFLRADPDVIMIGEMRDKETAETAIEASLTGHLVMSTLHTNSAVETVTRLLDVGCDAFNFADALLGVLAQRLCKRLCGRCKETYHPSPQEYEELVQGFGEAEWAKLAVEYTDEWILYRGRGCEACNNTGFKGRIPIHELLIGSPAIKHQIQSRAATVEILRVAMNEGMRTLVQDGIHKVLQGHTTYRQVRAVAMQ